VSLLSSAFALGEAVRAELLGEGAHERLLALAARVLHSETAAQKNTSAETVDSVSVMPLKKFSRPHVEL
jgi:hypothetical protein